jgi:hypothetical protein
MPADVKKQSGAPGKVYEFYNGQLVRVSAEQKIEERNASSAEPMKRIVLQTLKIAGMGSVATAVSFWFAGRFNFSPDGFGAVLVSGSGLLGAVMALLDKRPMSSGKLSALQIKRDTDFCGLLAAVLGFPSLVARVFAPAAGTHDFASILVTISAFILSYAVVLKFRSSNADYERRRLEEAEVKIPQVTPSD